MEFTQVDCSVLDRILSLFHESFSWVKTQIESFYKLLRTDLIKALLSAKTFIISCCEKFKLALRGINDLTDARVHKLSAEPGNEPSRNPEEILVVDESKKLIRKMSELVSRLLKCADPELRRKGEILKGFFALAEGFIDILELSFQNPLKLLLILLDGYLLYQSCAVNKASHIACKFKNCKDKGVMAIAALLSLFSLST